VAGATVVLLGAGVLVKTVTADADGCSAQGTRLVVAADPAIAPALSEIADRWQRSGTKAAGRCVRLEVQAKDSATMAGELGTFAGGAVDIGATPQPTPAEADLPGVWIPDSSAWQGRVLAVDRNAFEGAGTSVAISPVVVAMPEAAARQLTVPTPLTAQTVLGILGQNDKFRLGMVDPRRDSASLIGAMLLKDVVVTSEEKLPNLVGAYRQYVNVDKSYPDTKAVLAGFAQGLGAATVSEQSVIQYNAANPKVAAAAVPLAVEPTLDFPYTVLSVKSREIKNAAEMFRAALTGDAYADILAKYGLRTPTGAAGPGFAVGHGVTAAAVHVQPVTDMSSVRTTLTIWVAAKTPSHVIALADATSSMATPLGTGTRLDLLKAATHFGLDLFTSDSEIALWAYAGKGPQELVPMGTLDAKQRARLDGTMQVAHPAATDDCPLFESIIAAYKAIQDSYDPQRSNTIVVFTDGRSNLKDGLTLSKVKKELENLSDVARPIRVILMGIGPAADIGELQQIAAITGGGAFQLSDPHQLTQIFLKALLA
jgi:Bacterial extracellular solute-binding protein/von Willebrand factor type A domain